MRLYHIDGLDVHALLETVDFLLLLLEQRQGSCDRLLRFQIVCIAKPGALPLLRNLQADSVLLAPVDRQALGFVSAKTV